MRDASGMTPEGTYPGLPVDPRRQGVPRPPGWEPPPLPEDRPGSPLMDEIRSGKGLSQSSPSDLDSAYTPEAPFPPEPPPVEEEPGIFGRAKEWVGDRFQDLEGGFGGIERAMVGGGQPPQVQIRTEAEAQSFVATLKAKAARGELLSVEEVQILRQLNERVR